MSMRKIAAACVIMAASAGIPAMAMPIQTIACTPSADGSAIQVIATADGSESLTCVFSCHVKLAGQSRFQGFKCTGTVDDAAGEQLLCELKGGGPGYFAEAKVDRFDC